ncbi:MAG: DUF3473 domain-containing protein [Planctomycetes bacterium]|nr:DUF3473 domain-containing protein [Planctomycetota bacterium]
MAIVNAFTVDVEDYFHVSAFEGHFDRHSWDSHPCRVLKNTRRILELLDRHNVQGTFFVLGWVADRYPKLVREICRAGHELGSHSYWHRLIYRLDPDEFRMDLRESRDVLEQISGKRVTLYRAPSFSITRQSMWALEILAEEGFRIDSSVFPVYHDRYGIPDAPPEIHRVATPAGSLIEFPATTTRIGPLNMPVSGGGYFRLYPVDLTLRALRSVNERLERPFMFYIHPWEVDPDQPRVRAGSMTARMRHYVNLHRTEDKLDRLLSEFSFDTVSRVVKRVSSRSFDVGAAPYVGLTPAV